MSQRDDALIALEEIALSLRESAEQAEIKDSYDEGRLMGYYEALSTLMAQCQAVDIDLSEIGLTDFKPESVLRSAKSAAA